MILTTEATGVAPDQPAVSLTNLLKSHGRYTNLPFWRSVLIERRAGSGYESTVEPVVSREQAEHGFTELYLGAAKSKGQEP